MQESTKLNYVEFASLDIRRSKAFFESAFGWCFTDYGSEYSAFSNAGMDGGIFFCTTCDEGRKWCAFIGAVFQ